MDVHRRVGTYTVRVAHWFKSSFTGNNAPFNTNGIQCIYKRNENKRSKFVLIWVFTKVSVLCTSKNWYVHKTIGYVHGNNYVHKKNFGTYTVREAHDRLRNSRKNEFGFIVQIGSIMEKDVSLMKSFEKRSWKCFWKVKYTYKKFGKESGFKSLKESPLKVL